MELNLYLKEDGLMKVLKVPQYVVKDLLRDRLSRSELNRIHRFAETIKTPEIFKPGSVIVDFSNKSAKCIGTRLKMADLEPTWDVKDEKVTLGNY